MSDVLRDINALAAEFQPVGSRVTCRPPVTDTDADYLVLVESDSAYSEIAGMGFEIHDGTASTYDTPEDMTFTSWRLGELNLLVTESPLFFSRFMAATSVATRLNLLDKPDRIALFRAVLYGEECEPSLAQLNDAAAELEHAYG